MTLVVVVERLDVGVDVGLEVEVLNLPIEAVESGAFGLPDELTLPPLALMLCQSPELSA